MVVPRAAAKRISTGQRIRVLVVDDSVVVRRLVVRALEEDPVFEVVGVAPNGSVALAKIPQVRPDIITLDVEMPEMNGLEALPLLRRDYPDLCVIMFSTQTERGGHYTLEALALGANDYVTKPASVGSLDQSMERLRSELIPKIKQFFELESERAFAPLPILTPSLKKVAAVSPLAIKREVVAIGVSTGGPNALAEIFPVLPKDFPCPVLVVQHMPPLFTRLLAERLDHASRISVEEAQEGMEVVPGKALIAPGNYHMRVKRSGTKVVIALDQSPPENSCRPAVDVLFRSVSDVYGPSVLAVILTGMGQDGFLGIQDLRTKGAFVVAQDQATSVVWGMPGYVVQSGLADVVAGLDRVAPEIIRRV